MHINVSFCSINYKTREIKQQSYSQIAQLTLDAPTYALNPYLIQCQSNVQNVLLYMLAHVRKHPCTIVNLLKYIHHKKYEILSKENTLSTRKL